MKLLIDEQTPVQYRDVLAFLLPGHEVAHVNDLRWKSKKDAALLADAVRRGYEVFLTNDVRQLEDPAETDAIRRSGIHHVRYRIPRTRTVPLAHLGLALGAVAAAMPMVMTALASAKSQRLVLVKGVSTNPADRYEAVDPTARHLATGPESTPTRIQWAARPSLPPRRSSVRRGAPRSCLLRDVLLLELPDHRHHVGEVKLRLGCRGLRGPGSRRGGRRMNARASRAASCASGRACRYFSVVTMLPCPRRSLTT